MRLIDDLVDRLGRRLQRWGDDLLRRRGRAEAVAADIAVPAPARDPLADVRSIWEARVAHLPPGAWQGFGDADETAGTAAIVAKAQDEEPMAVDLMSSTLASSIVRAAPRWLDRRDVPAPVDAAPRTAATDAAGPPVRPRHVPAAAPTRSPATRRSATRFLRPTSTPTESFSPPQATAWLEPAPKAAAPSAAPAIGAARPWWAALLPRLWPQRASWRALDWRGLRGLGSRRPAAALAPPRLNQASSVRTPAPSTAPSPARTRSDLYDHVPAHSGSPSIATRRAAPPVQPAEAYSADLAAAFAPSDAAFTPDRDARAALRRHSAESQPTPVRPHPGSFTNPVSQRGLGRPMYSPKFATAAPARATPVDTVHRWPELPPWPADPVRDDASAPWAADRLRRLEAEQRG